ncbi:MAG: histidine kinase [Bacteroidales bacterium]|nr:histidine kinase [Bacteroidales bacterium]MBN2818156.1 histidine kinase [Bacteroidales bacterium]
MEKKPKLSFKKLIRSFLLMIVGLVALTILLSLAFSGFKWFSSWEDLFNRTIYGFVVGFFFGIGNWAIGVFTGRLLNWRRKLVRSNLIALLTFIFYGIIVSIIVPYYFGTYIWKLTGDNLKYAIIENAFINIAIDLVVISVYYSFYLVYYWNKALERYEDLKRENINAKYNALKNQVNPHFLFNSLNTLTGVVEQDQQLAVKYIKKLSDIYRYVLEQQNKELIQISKELEFLNDFIYLSEIRHGEGLKTEISIGSADKYIVPLGIQLLVENAIKHNIISDDQPLSIQISEEDGYLVVKNNLQKKNSIKNKEPQGIENLINRYEYISDKPVQVEESANEFVVKIPIIDQPEL